MTNTKTKPIIFSGPMVRAILAGRKSQTRRIWKTTSPTFRWWNVDCEFDDDGWPVAADECGEWVRIPCPYGAPGGRLWVRETWNVFVCSQDGDCSWPMKEIPKDDPRPEAYRNQIVVDYSVASTCGGTDGGEGPWRPSIHMPRWASRITLEITDVRVERLQDISEEDAIAEGFKETVDPVCCENPVEDPYVGGTVCCGRTNANLVASARDAFHDLWGSINGPDSWDANPWVWALTFKVVD